MSLQLPVQRTKTRRFLTQHSSTRIHIANFACGASSSLHVPTKSFAAGVGTTLSRISSRCALAATTQYIKSDSLALAGCPQSGSRIRPDSLSRRRLRCATIWENRSVSCGLRRHRTVVGAGVSDGGDESLRIRKPDPSPARPGLWPASHTRRRV